MFCFGKYQNNRFYTLSRVKNDSHIRYPNTVVITRSNLSRYHSCHCDDSIRTSQIAKFTGPTCGPPGPCRSQMGLMLVPWASLSGLNQTLNSQQTLHTLPSRASYSEDFGENWPRHIGTALYGDHCVCRYSNQGSRPSAGTMRTMKVDTIVL